MNILELIALYDHYQSIVDRNKDKPDYPDYIAAATERDRLKVLIDRESGKLN